MRLSGPSRRSIDLFQAKVKPATPTPATATAAAAAAAAATHCIIKQRQTGTAHS